MLIVPQIPKICQRLQNDIHMDMYKDDYSSFSR